MAETPVGAPDTMVDVADTQVQAPVEAPNDTTTTDTTAQPSTEWTSDSTSDFAWSTDTTAPSQDSPAPAAQPQAEAPQVTLGEAFGLDQQAAPQPTQENAQIDASAPLEQQLPALQQALGEQLSLVNQPDWNYDNAEQLLQYIAPTEAVRQQIAQTHPELAQQMSELQAAIEQAKLHRQADVQAELVTVESIAQQLNLPENFSLDQLEVGEVDVKDLVENPAQQVVEAIADGQAGAITTKEGEKHTFLKTAVMVALFAYDITHGGNSLTIISNTLSEAVLVKLGVDPEKAHELISSSGVHEQMLFSFNDRELHTFLERRIDSGRTGELYLFMKGISKKNRTDLLSGKSISGGGFLGNTLRLQPEMQQKVLKTLSKDQLRELELDSLTQTN